MHDNTNPPIHRIHSHVMKGGYVLTQKDKIDIAEAARGYYSSIKKDAPYLYEAYYDDLNYSYAKEYFKKQNADVPVGGCSSLRKNEFFGRNYDWTYGNQAEFVVQVSKTNGRNASIGIAGGINKLTQDFVDSAKPDELYRIVPFYMLDGINEHGVTASMNVVPLDKGENISVPHGEKLDEICGTMLIRYILDSFSSAYEAVTYIRDHVSVYFTDRTHDMKYEMHYLICDAVNSYLLEFINNDAVITEMGSQARNQFMNRAYMTNFYLSDVMLNTSGSVYTPQTQVGVYNAIDTNRLTPNGSGLERYNLIASKIGSISTKNAMRTVLDDLLYTKAYSTSPYVANPFWYTEFVGSRGLTCVSSIDEYSPVVSIAGNYYANRTRDDGLTWQTVHSSIYDISNKILYVVPQESGIEYEFELKKEQSGGSNDHSQLSNRNIQNQHSISSITGLQDTLNQKLDTNSISAWAKQPQKPRYTASEVGALPDTTHIPNSLSELSEDATHRLVTDAEKQKWNSSNVVVYETPVIDISPYKEGEEVPEEIVELLTEWKNYVFSHIDLTKNNLFIVNYYDYEENNKYKAICDYSIYDTNCLDLYWQLDNTISIGIDMYRSYDEESGEGYDWADIYIDTYHYEPQEIRLNLGYDYFEGKARPPKWLEIEIINKLISYTYDKIIIGNIGIFNGDTFVEDRNIQGTTYDVDRIIDDDFRFEHNHYVIFDDILSEKLYIKYNVDNYDPEAEDPEYTLEFGKVSDLQ